MKRLVEKYPIGTAVKIMLTNEKWVHGRIVRHQHPAVWVETADKQQWFVTNQRRIQAADKEG